MMVADDISGDMVCRGCGTVVGQKALCEGQEWRTFSDDAGLPGADDPARASGPVYSLDDSLRTEIGAPGSSWRSDDRDLAQGQAFIAHAAPEAWRAGCKQVSTLATELKLMSTVTLAAQLLFKRASELGLTRGRPTRILVPAVVFAACRMENAARTMKEVCAASGCTLREIGRCYLALKNELGLEVQVASTTPFLPRLCNMLDITMPTQVLAQDVLEKVRARNLCVTRVPICVVASVVWLVVQRAKLPITLKQISSEAQVAEQSITKCTQELEAHADELFNPSSAKPKDVKPVVLRPVSMTPVVMPASPKRPMGGPAELDRSHKRTRHGSVTPSDCSDSDDDSVVSCKPAARAPAAAPPPTPATAAVKAAVTITGSDEDFWADCDLPSDSDEDDDDRKSAASTQPSPATAVATSMPIPTKVPDAQGTAAPAAAAVPPV